MIRTAIRRAREFEGAEAVVADAMESAAQGLSAISAIQGYAIPGKDLVVEVVLGGVAETKLYDVEPEVMGFFALASQERHDDYDPDVFDEPQDKGWFEIPEGFEAHVNVEFLTAMLVAKWDSSDDLDRACDLAAGADTVSHEVLHALEWIMATGGMTPMEVFDAGMGELSIKEVQDGIVARETTTDARNSEDEVEDISRVWTETVFPLYDAQAWVDRLDAAISPAPSPR